MPHSLDREEFLEGYLSEAEEHLRGAASNLLKLEQGLEKNERHPRIVRELFRSLHTLKGLSAMVGIEPIVEIAHEMEALLRVADQTATPLSREAIELSLNAVRAIEQRVHAVAKRKAVPAAPERLVTALRQLVAAPRARSETRDHGLDLEPTLRAKLSVGEREQLVQGIEGGRRALRIDFSPSPDKAADGVTITSVRERIGLLAEVVKVVPRSVLKTDAAPGGLTFSLVVLTAATDQALADAAATNHDALIPITLAPSVELPISPYDTQEDREISDDEALQRGTIRIDIARLDDAIDKLSALVVTRFRLARAIADLRQRGVDVRELQSVMAEHSLEIRHLRTSITRARMVSVAQVLERVPLLVRGMSLSTGKEVTLDIDAGHAELDKSVADRVFPALVHLVRNAVDHAIEAPAERQRLGKPLEGRITVRCFEHSNSQLELSVSDDGCGIDAERVAAKAGRAVPKDHRGLLDLITLPGLSTRDQATNRSGRGMGMDIVRRIAVDSLGGDLMLDTSPGVGTTFTLRIPLSISILDSLSFLCAGRTFVVPLAMVEEIVELEAGSVFSAPRPRAFRSEAKMLRRRGETIPLFDLRALLSEGGIDTVRDAVARVPGSNPSALIVQRNGKRLAFAVDRMLGQQEVVIRPLDDILVKVPGISGTTDLGDGRPTLVLDLSALASVRAQSLALHEESVA